MLLSARNAEEDLELERKVILEEIKMYEDDPEDFAHETLVRNIWRGHPLSRPITGTPETVCAITRSMLTEHVNRFYRPEKMIVSIAGKFDESKAIAQIETSISHLIKGEPKLPVAAPVMRQFRAVKHKDIEQTHISIATDGLKVIDDRRYIIAVLDLCLGGNMSSRLFQEVREKRGLVYTINTFRESHRENGLFGVYAASSPGQLPKVLELISAEFKRVKNEGFTTQEIARAKIQLQSDLLLGLESMRNRAARNAYGELFYGRHMGVDEILTDIERVTGDAVCSLANELLVPHMLSFVIVGPKSELSDNYAIAC